MKRSKIPFLSLLILTLTSGAYAESWNVPMELNDANSKITFELDTTWHKVHGTTKNISGKVWEKPGHSANKEVLAEVIIPVAGFDTKNKSRDETIRDVMDEDKFKNVTYELKNQSPNCAPESLKATGICTTQFDGTLTIRDITKDIHFPVTFKEMPDGPHIIGETTFRWDEYGVEDPSIFIARVDKNVTVKFDILITTKK